LDPIVEREKRYWEDKKDFEWLTADSIESVVSLLPPVGKECDVLELCGGSGMFTKRMPKTFRSYTALDLSSTLLKALKAAVPEAAVVQGDAQRPDFGERSFDLVVIFAGLHHMPDIRTTVANAFRILKRGGAFVCFEPNDACWYRRFMLPLKGLLGLYTEDEKFLRPDSVAEDLREAGFTDLRTRFLSPTYNPEHLGSALNKGLARAMALASRVGDGPAWQPWFILSGRKP